MFSIKVLSLSALCILLTVMAIVMHISRTHRDPGIPPYKPASAVLLAELGKLTVSLLLAWREVKELLVAERGQESGQAGLQDKVPRTSNSKFNEGVEEQDLDEQVQSRQRQTSAQMRATESQIPLLASSANEVGFSAADILQRMKKETFGHGWQHMSVPALLFTGQSNLAYYASSNLSVPIFQITYQLKIPATALCSVLMLGRSLSRMQWFSIVLLSLGVGIVQLATQAVERATHLPPPTIPSGSIGLNSTSIEPLLEVRSHTLEHVKPEMNQFLGLAAVCLACLSSGFASVFFEKQLKRPSTAPLAPSDGKEPRTPAPSSTIPPRKTGLWIRNIQLSLFSLSVGLAIYICTSQGSYIDFLQGFTPLVWFLVALQVSGGLLAALVIQYADNIAKSFSASCSIILSFGASMLLFDYQLTPGVLLGSVAVIGATWLFNSSGTKPIISTAAEAKPFVSQLKSPKAEYAPLHVPSRKPSSQSLAGLANASNPFLVDGKCQIPSRPPSRLGPH